MHSKRLFDAKLNNWWFIVSYDWANMQKQYKKPSHTT